MEPITTLGKKLKGDEQRDAIHLAILPVISDEEWLSPGERIKFVFGTTTMVCKAKGPEYGDPGIGVVDPFLADYPDNIRRGDRFWMLMFPNTITGLRHEWAHPLVDNPPVIVNDAERWLRKFADEWNFDYDEMIRAASDPDKGEWGNFITARGRDLHSREELGADHALFWMNLAALTGRTFDQEHIENFGWSCSC